MKRLSELDEDAFLSDSGDTCYTVEEVRNMLEDDEEETRGREWCLCKGIPVHFSVNDWIEDKSDDTYEEWYENMICAVSDEEKATIEGIMNRASALHPVMYPTEKIEID